MAVYRRLGIPAEAARPLAAFCGSDELERRVKGHEGYRAAKAGDGVAATRLVRDLVPEHMSLAARRHWRGAIFAFPDALEVSGHNRIPAALAWHLADAAHGGTIGIVQINRAHRTGAKAAERLLVRPFFDGPINRGARHVIVDDVATLGGTLAELANHVRANGGHVIGAALLVNAARGHILAAKPSLVRLAERRFGDVLRNDLGIEPDALTGPEALYLAGFRDADALRDRLVKARDERLSRLAARGIS